MMFVSLDLETTGFNPKKDKIIEFGAIKFDLSGNKETLKFFVNPGIPLPQIITHITGITDKDLKSAPKFEEKMDEIKNFIGDLPIIGHNIKFDTGFLRENGIEMNNVEYDTLEMASILIPSLPSYSLEILSHVLKLTHEEKHRALDDSIAAMELFLKLTETFQNLSEKLIEKIKNLVKKSEWPLQKFLLELNPKKSEQKGVKQIAPTQKESYKNMKLAQEIINEPGNCLIELNPPYENLVEELLSITDKNTHICVPANLNVEKLDAFKNYISKEKVEKFCERKAFQNYEITALLKILVWLENTKTGLIKEISLFREEKDILLHVTADKDFIEIPNDKAIICSHEYLIEEKPKIENLILIDFEKFTKNLHYNLSSYLSLNMLTSCLNNLKFLYPNNQTVQSLISKMTILFGLIGMIFEKYENQSRYSQKNFIDQGSLSTKEWTDIKSTITNLDETSKELEEIEEIHSAPMLKNWWKMVEVLKDFFCNPDLAKKIYWTEKNQYEEMVIHISPIHLKNHTKEIFDKVNSYKIIDENIDLSDNGLFIKTAFGLPESLPVKILTGNTTFDIKIIKNAPGNDYENENFTAKYIISQMKTLKGRSALICNSKKQLEFFTVKLSKELAPLGIKVVSEGPGSAAKIGEKFNQDPEKSIALISRNSWDNFKYYDLLDQIFLHKLPFDFPEDPYLMSLNANFEDSFNEFQVPKAIFAFKKVLHRLKNNTSVTVFDPRILTRNYSDAFIKNLSSMAKIDCQSHIF